MMEATDDDPTVELFYCKDPECPGLEFAHEKGRPCEGMRVTAVEVVSRPVLRVSLPEPGAEKLYWVQTGGSFYLGLSPQDIAETFDLCFGQREVYELRFWRTTPRPAFYDLLRSNPFSAMSPALRRALGGE